MNSPKWNKIRYDFFSCAVVKLFIFLVTVNKLITKIPWGFKNISVCINYARCVCNWNR